VCIGCSEIAVGQVAAAAAAAVAVR